MWSQIGEGVVAALAALGLKSSFLVGLFGAAVSLRYMPDMKTWWQRLTTVFGGALQANYLAPLLVESFGIKSAGGEASLAFLAGLFGMSLVSAIIKTIQDGTLGQWLMKRFGGTNA